MNIADLFYSWRRDTERDLSRLTEGAKRALGSELKTILVFGSSASGEFRNERSDVNVLIVADNLSFASLKKLSPALEQWRRYQKTDPVLIEENELPTYARALPIEFLDMRQHHNIIFGRDPFSNLSISTKNLLAQCEQELSVKLLKLRQALAAQINRPRLLREIMAASSSSLLTLFRAVLRLEGDVAMRTKLEAAQALAKKLDIDPVDLERVATLHARRANDSIEHLAERYLDMAGKTLKYVASHHGR